jgi:hypothetical protein
MPPKNFKLNTPEYGKRRRIDFDASKDDFIKYTANSSPALMAHCGMDVTVKLAVRKGLISGRFQS